jgi:hypothetical protein
MEKAAHAGAEPEKGCNALGAAEYIEIDRIAPRIYLLTRLLMDLGI